MENYLKNNTKEFSIMESKTYNNKKSNIKTVVAASLTSIMIVGLLIYGVYFNHKASRKNNELEYQYQRTLNDMIDYVDYAQEYLFKATVASSPEMISNMLDGVTVCTHQAEACLAALPIEQHSLEKVSEFLVQLSDISSVWSQHVLNEGKLTNEEYDSLVKLCGYTQDLSGAVNLLGNNLADNSYTWAKLDSKTIKRISNPFSDFSPMTYDGKYSYHDEEFKPLGISGDILNREECKQKAISYLADILNVPEKEITVKFQEENGQNNIETYCFELKCKNNIFAYMDITKQGGVIYSMNITRPYKETNLSEEQGIKAGYSFLKSIGLDNMKNTKCISEGDSVVATFVYENDNVLYYPDEVKVRIALDNGAPTWFECHNYLESHSTSRNLKTPKISSDEAKKALGNHFDYESVQTVVNSTDFGLEYMAYEFKGRVSGIPVLVYIDAQTGTEREIKIIE